MSKFTISQNVLEVFLPEHVEYSTAETFAQIFKDPNHKNVQIIILNFKETSYVTLPGALYILSLCHILNIRNKLLATQIKDLKANIKHFLMTLRFFSTFLTRSNLLIDKSILSEESLIISKTQYSEKSIIFPLSSIIYNPEKSYFEDYTRNFVNAFREFFTALTRFPIFRYINDHDESQELYDALYENIKNIFDHSQSEGFAAVHASQYLKGTVMAFFDVGIGIAKSVLQANPPSITDEKDAIYWALKDGNSSKKSNKIAGRLSHDHNQGHGFTILKDFAEQKNGIVTIRTGKHQFVFRNQKWEDRTVSWFPGTQIIIYTPTA